MATTDSNGIVRVEASDDVAPLHSVLNSLAQSVSNAFDAEIRIHPVANVAARSAKVTEIGVGNISSARPLFVWRADAPTGRNLEYTVNGSTWLYYSSSADDTGWVTLTPVSGYAGTYRYRQIGRMIEVRWTCTTSIAAGVAVFPLFVMPAGVRPSGDAPAAIAGTGQYSMTGSLSAAGNMNIRNTHTAALAAHSGSCWYTLG